MTISADTGALEVHPAALREPLPLSLHHLPVVVSFAFFDGAGELLLLDPSAAEEGTALGAMTARCAGRSSIARPARLRLTRAAPAPRR